MLIGVIPCCRPAGTSDLVLLKLCAVVGKRLDRRKGVSGGTTVKSADKAVKKDGEEEASNRCRHSDDGECFARNGIGRT